MNRIVHHNCPICGHQNIKLKLNLQDYTVSKEFYDVLECERCGFMFTQNAPDAESIGPYYHSEDYVSHSDTKAGLFFKVYHQVRTLMLNRKRKAILQNVNLPSNPKILDIGTGRGYFLNHMQKHGFHCTGIEQDQKVRDAAKQDFSLNILPPAELYKMEAQQFDVITLWHVLEHVHDLRAYLETIKLLLKPEGLLVLALPNPISADAEKYQSFWAGWDLPIHLWHFRPKNVEELLQQYQFKLIDKRRLPFDPFYVSILSAKHKNSPMPMISGGLVGLWSYLKCLIDIDKTTSLIYFFKK